MDGGRYWVGNGEKSGGMQRPVFGDFQGEANAFTEGSKFPSDNLSLAADRRIRRTHG